MELFTLLFAASMIGFPAVFASLWPARSLPHDEPGRLEAIPRLKLRLWLGTTSALAAFLVLRVVVGLSLASYAWMACFPLWFGLAMPLLAAKDPGWRPVPQGRLRTAALARRDVLPSRMQRAWIASALLWVVLLTATVVGMLRGDGPWWMLLFSLSAGVEFGFFHWAMRRYLIEPEPRASDESEEVVRARKSLRNLKLWGWFGIATLAMFAFSMPPLVLSWLGERALNLAIGLGVGGGVLGGLGGSVFGVMADVYRSRINRELNAQREAGTSIAS